nr:MAG: capsid protein [Cressdnaviricota sp.]
MSGGSAPHAPRVRITVPHKNTGSKNTRSKGNNRASPPLDHKLNKFNISVQALTYLLFTKMGSGAHNAHKSIGSSSSKHAHHREHPHHHPAGKTPPRTPKNTPRVTVRPGPRPKINHKQKKHSDERGDVKDGYEYVVMNYKNTPNWPKKLMATNKYRDIYPFRVASTAGQQNFQPLAYLCTPSQMLISTTQAVGANQLTHPTIIEATNGFFDMNPNEFTSGGIGAPASGGAFAVQTPPTDMLYVSTVNIQMDIQNATTAPAYLEIYLLEATKPTVSTLESNTALGFTNLRLGQTNATQPTPAFAVTGVAGAATINVPGVLPKQSPSYKHFYKELQVKKFRLAPAQFENININFGIHKSYDKDVATQNYNQNLLQFPGKTFIVAMLLRGGISQDETAPGPGPQSITYGFGEVMGIMNVEYNIHHYTMAAKKAKVLDVSWGITAPSVPNIRQMLDLQLNDNAEATLF